MKLSKLAVALNLRMKISTPNFMKRLIRILTVSAFIGAYLFSLSSAQADKVLELELPKPKFSGTPVMIRSHLAVAPCSTEMPLWIFGVLAGSC